MATYACPNDECLLWREPVELPVSAPGPSGPPTWTGKSWLVTWTCKGCETPMERVDPNRMIVAAT